MSAPLSTPDLKKINDEIVFFENNPKNFIVQQKMDRTSIRKKLEELITNNLIFLQCQTQFLKLQSKPDPVVDEFNEEEQAHMQEMEIENLLLQKFYHSQQSIQQLVLKNMNA
jgi:hypothetical protein